jgi:hypothetical protein
MKKELLLPAAILLFALSSLGQTMTVGYAGQVPLNGNANICFTGQNTLNAFVYAAPPGTTSYTWSVLSSSCPASYSTAGGNSVAITFTCCANYTVVCSAYSSSNTLLQTASGTVNIVCAPAPTVGVASSLNGMVCPGTSHTLTASGATSYFWMPAQVNTVNPLVVTPVSGQCFTVFGSNGPCYSSAVHCTSVMAAPNLSIVSSPTICEGMNFTLAASGASSYTWNPGNLVSPMIIPVASLNVPSYTLSVTSGTCVFPGNVYTLQVIPAPILTITSAPSLSTPVMCGNTISLSVSGAATYTWFTWGKGFYFTGSTLVDTVFSMWPGSAQYVFTLSAYDINGCYADTGASTPVIPVPLSITGNNTVCHGSSITLTVTGGQTYTWSTSANTATLNYIPQTNTTMVVYGNAANGCIAKDSIALSPNAGCAIVWPGDANSDGVVNSSDVLEIGLAFSSTGAMRPGASNTYTGQQCSAWTGTVSSGKNKCHADCNGDGTVNLNDTLAITNNFQLTHTFRTAAASTTDIFLITQGSAASPGTWNAAEIHLGTSLNQISLLGLAFDVDYDHILIDSAYLAFSSSFVNNNGQNIHFRKQTFTPGKIYAASVRTTGNDVQGAGKIAEFRFKPKTTVTPNTKFSMGLSNGLKILTTGVTANLSTGTASLTISGLNEQAGEEGIRIYPNPATAEIHLLSGDQSDVGYVISDFLGRQVMEGRFYRTVTLNVTELPRGVYLISCKGSGATSHTRMILTR